MGVRVCLVGLVMTCCLLVPVVGVRAAPEEPELVAAAAIALDADTGRVLYGKNADVPRAPASLTKLATALTAVDLAPLETVLHVEAEDLVGEASMGLRPGDDVTLRTALYGLLLTSGNDAAMVIARNLSAFPGERAQASVDRFVRQMNLVAQRLGMERTTFRNPHGLDQEGHLSTARDLATLTRAVLQRPELRQILETPTYSDGTYTVQTTNRLLGRYPGLIGGKTGITDAAGYSLIEAAERDGRTVIVVILGSTREAWYEDAVRLLDFAFDRLSRGEGDRPLPEVVAPPPLVPATPEATATRALFVHVPTSNARSTELWFWPASALTAAAVTGVLLVSVPVLAAMVVARRSRPRVHRERPPRTARVARHPERRRPGPVRKPASHPPHHRSGELDEEQRAPLVVFDPAVTVAQRGIRAGRRGDIVVAEQEFMNALRLNPAFDLTRTPEFWTLSPLGVVAAARAYRRVGRIRDARTLLTVAQLSFGNVPVIHQALRELPQQWVLSRSQEADDSRIPHP